jgi:hypothetical protein
VVSLQAGRYSGRLLTTTLPNYVTSSICGYTFTVAKKKKPRKFSAVQAVKEMARDRIGAPGTEQVVPDLKKKRKSSEKHKPTLGQLLQEGE